MTTLFNAFWVLLEVIQAGNVANPSRAFSFVLKVAAQASKQSVSSKHGWYTTEVDDAVTTHSNGYVSVSHYVGDISWVSCDYGEGTDEYVIYFDGTCLWTEVIEA